MREALESFIMYDSTESLDNAQALEIIFMQYQEIIGGLTWSQVLNEDPDHVQKTVLLYNLRKKRENEELKTSSK